MKDLQQPTAKLKRHILPKPFAYMDNFFAFDLQALPIYFCYLKRGTAAIAKHQALEMSDFK